MKISFGRISFGKNDAFPELEKKAPETPAENTAPVLIEIPDRSPEQVPAAINSDLIQAPVLSEEQRAFNESIDTFRRNTGRTVLAKRPLLPKGILGKKNGKKSLAFLGPLVMVLAGLGGIKGLDFYQGYEKQSQSQATYRQMLREAPRPGNATLTDEIREANFGIALTGMAEGWTHQAARADSSVVPNIFPSMPSPNEYGFHQSATASKSLVMTLNALPQDQAITSGQVIDLLNADLILNTLKDDQKAKMADKVAGHFNERVAHRKTMNKLHESLTTIYTATFSASLPGQSKAETESLTKSLIAFTGKNNVRYHADLQPFFKEHPELKALDATAQRILTTGLFATIEQLGSLDQQRFSTLPLHLWEHDLRTMLYENLPGSLGVSIKQFDDNWTPQELTLLYTQTINKHPAFKDWSQEARDGLLTQVKTMVDEGIASQDYDGAYSFLSILLSILMGGGALAGFGMTVGRNKEDQSLRLYPALAKLPKTLLDRSRDKQRLFEIVPPKTVEQGQQVARSLHKAYQSARQLSTKINEAADLHREDAQVLTRHFGVEFPPVTPEQIVEYTQHEELKSYLECELTEANLYQLASAAESRVGEMAQNLNMDFLNTFDNTGQLAWGSLMGLEINRKQTQEILTAHAQEVDALNARLLDLKPKLDNTNALWLADFTTHIRAAEQSRDEATTRLEVLALLKQHVYSVIAQLINGETSAEQTRSDLSGLDYKRRLLAKGADTVNAIRRELTETQAGDVQNTLAKLRVRLLKLEKENSETPSPQQPPLDEEITRPEATPEKVPKRREFPGAVPPEQRTW